MESVNHKRPILTYPIASGELHYAVENERTVYVQDEPETGFSLYGQLAGATEASSVNLAEVLLEFAMTWNTRGDPSEAQRQMGIFGGHIGEALAAQSATNEPFNSALGLAACALGDVLRSLDASFAYYQTPNQAKYQLDACPLCAAAEATGLVGEAELAYHGLNAICQSLVSAIDPQLRVQLPGTANGKNVISILAPASNGR